MESTPKKTTNKQANEIGNNMGNGSHSSKLMDLFEEQLKEILWSEKALVKTLPQMISMATSIDLIVMLSDHLQETRGHISRLASVFRSINIHPTIKQCGTMEALITEAGEIMENCHGGPKCDAGLITAVQKIEHYEIATYGTLREFAISLGLREAEKLFTDTLKEEKNVDQRMTKIVVQRINREALSLQKKRATNLGEEAGI